MLTPHVHEVHDHLTMSTVQAAHDQVGAWVTVTPERRPPWIGRLTSVHIQEDRGWATVQPHAHHFGASTQVPIDVVLDLRILS